MVLNLTFDLRAALIGAALLLAGWVVAIPLAVAFADDVAGSGSRAAPGTGFTYQGRFEQDGVPANGSYFFRFTLRSDAIANTTVGAPLTKSVTVSDGHFATTLDFGVGAFNGDARWIDVEVDAGTGFVALPPRQALTATPYALYSLETAPHSHFGATWNGYDAFAGLNVANSNTTIGTYSIFAQTDGEFTAAIAGYAPESGTGTIGVAQHTPGSTRGIGMIGRSFYDGTSPMYLDSIAAGSGVYAETNASSGAGVFGAVNQANRSQVTYGTYDAGVFGINLSPVCQSRCVGVKGFAYVPVTGSQESTGVYGGGTSYGVFGSGDTGVGGTGSVSGLTGTSANGAGVTADGKTGVKATSNVSSGTAVSALALGANGVGVHAYGQAWAGNFVGNIQIFGSITYTSDGRLKHDVRQLGKGLDEVLALHPVSYLFTEGAQDDIRYGFIAQDVQHVLPDLVRSDTESGMLSLDYVELIPVLVRAIQEQQVEIEALKAGR